MLKENIYPVTQVGIANMLEMTIQGWEHDLQVPGDEVDVQFFPNAKEKGVPCEAIQVTHQKRLKELKYYRNRIYFDKGDKAADRGLRFGWPQQSAKNRCCGRLSLFESEDEREPDRCRFQPGDNMGSERWNHGTAARRIVAAKRLYEGHADMLRRIRVRVIMPAVIPIVLLLCAGFARAEDSRPKPAPQFAELAAERQVEFQPAAEARRGQGPKAFSASEAGIRISIETRLRRRKVPHVSGDVSVASDDRHHRKQHCSCGILPAGRCRAVSRQRGIAHPGRDFLLSETVASHLARNGVAALSVEMPYYGPRRRPGTSKRMTSEDPRVTVAGMTQAVLDQSTQYD